jgi:hypothetical protein
MNPLFLKDILPIIINGLQTIGDVACLRRTCRDIRDIIDKQLGSKFKFIACSKERNVSAIWSRIGNFYRFITYPYENSLVIKTNIETTLVDECCCDGNCKDDSDVIRKADYIQYESNGKRKKIAHGNAIMFCGVHKKIVKWRVYFNGEKYYKIEERSYNIRTRNRDANKEVKRWKVVGGLQEYGIKPLIELFGKNNINIKKNNPETYLEVKGMFPIGNTKTNKRKSE